MFEESQSCEANCTHVDKPYRHFHPSPKHPRKERGNIIRERLDTLSKNNMCLRERVIIFSLVDEVYMEINSIAIIYVEHEAKLL